jgi:hypothetical protein
MLSKEHLIAIILLIFVIYQTILKMDKFLTKENKKFHFITKNKLSLEQKLFKTNIFKDNKK